MNVTEHVIVQAASVYLTTLNTPTNHSNISIPTCSLDNTFLSAYVCYGIILWAREL